jgi:dUTP pyrophosphatase
MKMRFKKLHPEAKAPTYAHATDAGMDLYTIEDFTIEPGGHYNASTGISLLLPDGYVGLIWDKGGIGMQRHIKTIGGVFDTGYQGDYTIGLVNLGQETQVFKKGDKIAQILIQAVEHPELIEVEEFEATARGEGRFGSTGK